MDDDLERRLEQWETRSAFQEATVQDLSLRVYEQQLTIERLERQLAALADKVRSLAAGETAPLPENERPPHY